MFFRNWETCTNDLAVVSPFGVFTADGPRMRSRSRGASSSGDRARVVETEEASLLSFSLALAVHGVSRVGGFDEEPYDHGHGPRWYLKAIEVDCELMNRGHDAGDLDRRLWKALLCRGDDRFTAEAGIYIGGISRGLERHRHGQGGQPWAPPRPYAPPARVDVDMWVRETLEGMRKQWFWLVCPVAVHNRQLESGMEAEGYPDPTCSAIRYAEEDREAATSRLSRSRTPQRTDVRKRLGLRRPRKQGRQPAEGQSQPEMDEDEVTLMEVGRGRQRNSREEDSHDERPWRSRPVNPRWLRRSRSRDDRASRRRSGVKANRPKSKARPRPPLCRTTTSTRRLASRLRFEQDVPVVQNGQPLLPDHTTNMIEETISTYDDNDRAIMTTAFLRLLRMLMAEVSMAFERGVRIAEARVSDEVLADVRVDAEPGGDSTSMMQRSLTAMMRQPTTSTCSSLRSEALQGKWDQLQAMLIAMTADDHGPAGVCDIGWQVRWWNCLFPVASSAEAASSTGRVVLPGAVVDGNLMPTVDQLLEDEEEHRAAEVKRREERGGRVPPLPGGST
eukprot:s6358_g2.t1